MEFNDFLRENALYIVLFFAALIGLNIVLYFVIPLVRKKDEEKPKVDELVANYDAFFTATGGKQNIDKLTLTGSRLSLYVKNRNLINVDNLKKAGVIKIIIMSDRYVLLIDDKLKGIVEEFYK
jgi:phosphotransferase system IIB component